ncbi:cysteine-rich secretory protein 2-like isoform X1 [Pelodiscus sinensis]
MLKKVGDHWFKRMLNRAVREKYGKVRKEENPEVGTEMVLLTALVCLAIWLPQSVGQGPAPANTAMSTDFPEIQREITDKHNELRRSVNPMAGNMLKMAWSAEAAKNAKSWADQCTYFHSPESRRKVRNITCGENLCTSSFPVSWSTVLQWWFNEKDNFIFNIGPTSSNVEVGHYTQMAWYKSFEIGCAAAFCANTYYYVCHYCPAGNMKGAIYTPYKIGDPCSDCPDACDNGLCKMILLAAFLGLAAMLQRTVGEEAQETPDFAALSTDNEDQQREIVDKHNALRREVKPTAGNMLKMEWSTKAAENAKIWANECTLSHSPPNRRKTTLSCGENLLMSVAPHPWSIVIQSWYNEVENFKHGIGLTKPGEDTGHFTQVVWYSSYEVGCAVAYCPEKYFKYYYVCQYCPQGNNLHLINTPYKAGTACEHCPDACDNGLCTNPCKYEDVFGNCNDLKRSPGCGYLVIRAGCHASCVCTTEIH